MKKINLDRPFDLHYPGIGPLERPREKLGLDLRFSRRGVILPRTGSGIEGSIKPRHNFNPYLSLPRLFPRESKALYEHQPNLEMRKCLVKIRYESNRDPSLALSRLIDKINYIGRSEATVETKPFYEKANLERALYTYTKDGEKKMLSKDEAVKHLKSNHVFKIILSPEDKNTDLCLLAKKFMRDSFYSSSGMGIWSEGYVCANHYNTDNPHVHILVSRKIKNQKELARLPREYITKMRAQNDASRILTQTHGYKNARDLQQERAESVKTLSYTGFDKDILKRAKKGYVMIDEKRHHLAFVITESEIRNILSSRRDSVIKRLDFLSEKTDLCIRHGKTYELVIDWEKKLRNLDMARKLNINNKDAIFDYNINAPYKGTIKSFLVEDDFADSLIIEIEDEKGKTHIIKETIHPSAYDNLLGQKVSVLKSKKGKRAGESIIANKKDLER